MVQPKGWDGVKPYWWCDTPFMHAVADHIRKYTNTIPPYMIYVKGTQKAYPNSIEINTINESDIIHVKINNSDIPTREAQVMEIRLILDDAIISGYHFKFNKEEIIKKYNEHILQYKFTLTHGDNRTKN